MGIIGIVSALTLPNLNSSTGDKERVAKVKKIYRDLNDAYGRAEAVYGPFSDWFVNVSDDTAAAKRVGERVTEFMKLSKECKMEANQGCFKGNYDASTSVYKIITADGCSIAFGASGANNAESGGRFSIVVDIDGPTKGSNEKGKDIFTFERSFAYIDKGVFPYHNYPETTFSVFVSEAYSSSRATAAAWIIKFDNADYLKLDSSGKCPNGTTPTEANPRCK